MKLIESDVDLGQLKILKVPTYHCEKCKSNVTKIDMMARIEKIIENKKIKDNISFEMESVK
jgi:hypothetical protein